MFTSQSFFVYNMIRSGQSNLTRNCIDLAHESLQPENIK